MKDFLFGAVKLTKDSDPDKYNYQGYGIGFDSRGTFTHRDGDYGVNVIIFNCDLSNSTHLNNRQNHFLILSRSLAEELNGVTLYTEKMHSPNFSVKNKTFVLSLHYNGSNSYLFTNGKEFIKFKAADSEIKSYPLCLGNISRDFRSANAQKTGLYGHVYDFSVVHWNIGNDKILDIRRYLMKKTIPYKIFEFIKKILAVIFSVSSVNSWNAIPLKCILACILVLNNEYMIYPFSIKINKYSGNCDNINNPYSRVCVPNIIENITAKVFDLISWRNKTKQIKRL